MKDRQLLIFLTFIPIALTVFIWGIDSHFVSAPNAEPNQVANNLNLPTTILERTRLTQYDEAGIKAQRITSAKLVSNDFQEQVDIEMPVITLDTGKDQWTAQSHQGEFHQQENRLSLLGSVVLTQNKGQTPVQMRTEQLDYYPEIRLAETQTPVVIEADGHHIQSIGIRVDLANSIYTLPERVRSTHEPL